MRSTRVLLVAGGIGGRDASAIPRTRPANQPQGSARLANFPGWIARLAMDTEVGSLLGVKTATPRCPWP